MFAHELLETWTDGDGVLTESCFKETALRDVDTSIKYYLTVSSVVLCL